MKNNDSVALIETRMREEQSIKWRRIVVLGTELC